MTIIAAEQPRYRVTCPSGGATPAMTSLNRAERAQRDADTPNEPCEHRFRHTIEVQTNPDGEWVPLHVHRTRQILAAPVGPALVDTPDGPLIKMYGGWSKETAQRPGVQEAFDRNDMAAAEAILGSEDEALLTSDGRDARTRDWCRCDPYPVMEEWVRYERYSPRGREAHGYVCPTCRRLTQSG